MHLTGAVESLARQTVPPQRVIVVDNASDDDSLDGLDLRFPSVEVVRSTENLGFAAANNLAIQMCDDCEFVALLNPDAFAEPEWLETLLRAAAGRSDCAAFGSKLVLASNRDTLDGTGDHYHVSGLAWRRDQGAPVSVEREPGETFSACAAAALYRRDALVAVGGFEESFFCYYEDTDLAFRLRLAGHRVVYVPDAVALHVGSATTGALSSFTIYHSARNQLWTYVRNMPGPLLWLYLPQHLLVTALATLAYALHGQGGAAFAGKRDGLRELPRVLEQRRRIQAARVAGSWDLRRAMSRGASGYMLTFASRAREWRRGLDPAERKTHLRHLDGLRGLTALYVVLHHTWLTIWPDIRTNQLPIAGKATRVLAFGHFGVVVFIVLSGFCLAIPVARAGELPGGARRFFLRRARRLLPPYYASFALSLLLVWTLIGQRTGSHWDISVPVDWRGYLGNGLLLGDVFGGGQINHVWWSVGLEAQIYLAFPLLVGCWLYFGAGTAAILGSGLAAAAWLATSLVPNIGQLHLAGAMPWFLALFSFGMLGAAVVETDARSMKLLRNRTPWTALAFVASGATVAVCVVAGRDAVFSHLPLMDVLVGVAAACVIVASCRGNGPLRRALSYGPLVFVGGFSYSLYLIHAPLLQLVWQYDLRPLGLDATDTFLLLALGGVPLILCISYLFSIAFERPFLSAEHRARLRRPEAREPRRVAVDRGGALAAGAGERS